MSTEYAKWDRVNKLAAELLLMEPVSPERPKVLGSLLSALDACNDKTAAKLLETLEGGGGDTPENLEQIRKVARRILEVIHFSET